MVSNSNINKNRKFDVDILDEFRRAKDAQFDNPNITFPEQGEKHYSPYNTNDFIDYNKPAPKQQNANKNRLKKDAFVGRRILKTAAVISLFGSAGYGVYSANIPEHAHNAKIDIMKKFASMFDSNNTLSAKNNDMFEYINSTSLEKLDNEEIDISDWNVVEPKKNEDEKVIFSLKGNGSAVRTTPKQYDTRPEDGAFDSIFEFLTGEEPKPDHSAIFYTKPGSDPIDFEIKGEIREKDGTYAIQLKNFEKTADGKFTGLDSSLDKDGISFITPNEGNFK